MVALVHEMGEIGHLVNISVRLRLEVLIVVLLHGYVVESVEIERLSSILSIEIMFPIDEAQVEECASQ